MVKLLPPEEVQWDVVTGVSAGSINAGGMGLFPIGKEKEMISFMENILENIKTENVYTLWDEPIMDGLLRQSGVFNNTPLLTFLTDILNKEIDLEGEKRRIVVSAVDSNTGNTITFNEQGLKDLFPTQIKSSCSIPFIFPTVKLDKMVLIDGGASYGVNIISAIDRCREIVEDDS